MNKKDLLKLLNDQLDGLAKTVESDENFEVNRKDHLVTLNSLRKRLEKAQKTPDDTDLMIGGIKTGRTGSKILGPVGETGMTTAEPNTSKAKLPMTDRRAAIQHTKKLNENINYS